MYRSCEMRQTDNLTWMKTVILLSVIVVSKTDHVGSHNQSQDGQPTRRILGGKKVGETRPYMVYLRPSPLAEHQFQEMNWLCGGVIIHERYILTSAACIEDAKNFFVVSGTNKFIPMTDETNECIKYGAKKAIWKCVPKNYYFDGAEFDNIRWMSGDIAVVKVEDDFNFNKRVRGCDYIPSKIPFNNVSIQHEKSGTLASVAGWGNTQSFGDIEIARTSENSPVLLETDVQLISKKNCKRHWDSRYHHIIDDGMICTKDNQDAESMSSACIEQGIKCKELEYEIDEEDDYEEPLVGRPKKHRSRRVLVISDSDKMVHGASHHIIDGTRRTKTPSGGFCENDHGGPLIVGHGKTSMVVGIISACMTANVSKKCFGPFLYTSVWSHRHLISCAIDKELGSTCRRALKTSNTQIYEVSFDWPDNSNKNTKGTTTKNHTQFGR